MISENEILTGLTYLRCQDCGRRASGRRCLACYKDKRPERTERYRNVRRTTDLSSWFPLMLAYQGFTDAQIVYERRSEARRDESAIEAERERQRRWRAAHEEDLRQYSEDRGRLVWFHAFRIVEHIIAAREMGGEEQKMAAWLVRYYDWLEDQIHELAEFYAKRDLRR